MIKKYIKNMFYYNKIYFIKNIVKTKKISFFKKILKKHIPLKYIYKKIINVINNCINNNIIIDVNNNKENTYKEKIDKENTYKVKFCVFLGREKNLKILHPYIEEALDKNIIDEYHMYNFSRNKNDNLFILNEFERLIKKYHNRIFIFNSDENLLLIDTKRTKMDWSPFYKNISNSNKNDIIIKCDDDILFIDIYSLKNAIEDRKKDKISFLIHSNCINNGLCSYYQRKLFNKLENELNIYPTGGILGVIFEKPELAYVMHNQFVNDLLSDLNNINKYVLKEDIFINSRISINFILLRGEDAIHLKDITTDDEYELSGFIPEKLLRPNKIKGDFITSHFSYTFQDKLLSSKPELYNNYLKLKDYYLNKINNNLSILNNYNILSTHIPKAYFSTNNNKEQIFKIKNWFNQNNYYIKNIETNKYLNIDYDNDEFYLSDNKKTYYDITTRNNNIIVIKLGIYTINRYNIIGKFRNEILLIKYFRDEREKEILLENENDFYYLKFLKHNLYLSLNNKFDKIEITNNKKNKWILEKIDIKDQFINCKRFIKNNKFYYQNIENDIIYTNYYKGWGLENILW